MKQVEAIIRDGGETEALFCYLLMIYNEINYSWCFSEFCEGI